MAQRSPTRLSRLSSSRFSETPGQSHFTGRVLIVGNDAGSRRTIAILARIEGCDTREVDLEQAEINVGTWRPDLVVMDLTPAEEAVAVRLVSSIRALISSDIPVIVLSEASADQARRAQLGASAMLLKPFAAVTFLDLLAEHVNCG